MKYSFTLLLGILLMLTACSKETENQTVYEGLWELIDVSGGFVGSDQSAPWQTMKIDGDVLSLLIDDEAIYKATIEIVTTQSFNQDRVTFEVSFNEESITNKLFDNIDIKDGNKLSITDECCDLYDYSFIKN